MKMGIKEFRERIGDVALGADVVVLTHHGKRVGRYLPDRARAPRDVDLDAWVREREQTARAWRAATPDWRERLLSIGFAADEVAELEADDRCS